MPNPRPCTQPTAGRTLDVLAALMPHFAHGLTPGDIAQVCRLHPSSVTRSVATLMEHGWAERIPATGRIRPSVRMARYAIAILRSLDAARAQLDELNDRLRAG